MSGFNKWSQVAQNMKGGIKEAVANTAKYIATTYSANAPVDTGFMASTSYYVTSEESTYGQGFGTPPGDAYLFPEADKPADDYSATAAVAASYAVFPEMGTRFQSPQPAWYPAIDSAQQTFDTELAAIDGKLGGSIS